MKDGKFILVICAFSIALAGYGLCNSDGVSQIRNSKNEIPSFEVDIQSGGSGTTLRTDGFNDFSYLNGGK